MLQARGVRAPRLPHVFHLMRAFGLDRLAARRDVFVYDVEPLVRQWFRGPMAEPLPQLSADDIAALRAPGAVLILDWSGEAAPFPEIGFRNLADWCARHQVPLSHVVFVDEDPASKVRQFDRWAAATGAGERMRFAFGHHWLDAVTASAAKKVPAATIAAGMAAAKAHRFLCLNNAPRLHRVLIAEHVLRQDPASLVSLGLSKIATEAPDSPNNAPFGRKATRRDLAPFAASADFMARHGDLVRGFDRVATAARGTLTPIALPTVHVFDEALYGRALLSVVGETEMVRNGLKRVTEKTIKAALFGHPFLVAGNPRSLELVRRLGFKTFPTLFDEGYDTIADPVGRLGAVLDEITRLAALPFADLVERVEAVRGDVADNHDWAMRGLRLGYNAFMCRQLAALIEGGPGVMRPADVGPFTTV